MSMSVNDKVAAQAQEIRRAHARGMTIPDKALELARRICAGEYTQTGAADRQLLLKTLAHIAESTPTFEEVGADETLVRVSGAVDDLGRCRFTAFWRATDALLIGQVRGQVFFTDLERFIEREVRRGSTVRLLGAARD